MFLNQSDIWAILLTHDYCIVKNFIEEIKKMYAQLNFLAMKD